MRRARNAEKVPHSEMQLYRAHLSIRIYPNCYPSKQQVTRRDSLPLGEGKSMRCRLKEIAET